MFRNLFYALALIGLVLAAPAGAQQSGSLFVNLTTDEPHRANMAMTFSKRILEGGHPVTVWLNDRGVFLASRQHNDQFADQQKALADLMDNGANVIICPFCAAHYEVDLDNIVDGIQTGGADVPLFQEGTRTLTW